MIGSVGMRKGDKDTQGQSGAQQPCWITPGAIQGGLLLLVTFSHMAGQSVRVLVHGHTGPSAHSRVSDSGLWLVPDKLKVSASWCINLCLAAL